MPSAHAVRSGRFCNGKRTMASRGTCRCSRLTSCRRRSRACTCARRARRTCRRCCRSTWTCAPRTSASAVHQSRCLTPGAARLLLRTSSVQVRGCGDECGHDHNVLVQSHKPMSRRAVQLLATAAYPCIFATKQLRVLARARSLCPLIDKGE